MERFQIYAFDVKGLPAFGLDDQTRPRTSITFSMFEQPTDSRKLTIASSPSVSSLKVSLYAPSHDGVDGFRCRPLLFHQVL
jgi:hypothetical protein